MPAEQPDPAVIEAVEFRLNTERRNYETAQAEIERTFNSLVKALAEQKERQQRINGLENWSNVLQQEWFAVVDTVVGGWAIATVDKPTHEIEPPERIVACLADNEEIARHIAQLHNQWLL